MVQEEPWDIRRRDNREMCFGNLREYLQVGRNFSIVRKEDWSSEEYEMREDIPEEYDKLYVYGIDLEDNFGEISIPRNRRCPDSYLTKRMVIVLSETPRGDTKQKGSRTTKKRTCGSCRMADTVYWKVNTGQRTLFATEGEEFITWERIRREPESLLQAEKETSV